MQLKIKKLYPDAAIPKFATAGAACFDLHAYMPGESELRVYHPTTFETGLAFEIPERHVMLIFSRSGHGFNYDVRLANAVGVLDADYRGQVFVRLTPDHHGVLVVNHGDRIAQALILPLSTYELVEVEELSDTARGTGGLGSTGK